MSVVNTVLRIVRDTDPLNPREEWDNVGVMACRHSRYTLGDTQIDRHTSLAEYRKNNIKSHSLVLPLYLYDHSGITISTGPFTCPWDSGQVGWAWITRDSMFANWPPVNGDEETMHAKARACLEAEVEVYNQYLQGDVWGFELVELSSCLACGSVAETELDSCWGFYGPDYKTNGILDHLPKDVEYTVEQED